MTYHSLGVATTAVCENTMEKLPEFIANHLFLVTLFVSLAALLLWSFTAGTAHSLRLDPTAATHFINRDNATVLDLRGREDFLHGHIIGAANPVHKTPDDLDQALAQYKDAPTILYCAYGRDSARIARRLKRQGFGRIHCLKGGLHAWQTAHLPVVKDDD